MLYKGTNAIKTAIFDWSYDDGWLEQDVERVKKLFKYHNVELNATYDDDLDILKIDNKIYFNANLESEESLDYKKLISFIQEKIWSSKNYKEFEEYKIMEDAFYNGDSMNEYI